MQNTVELQKEIEYLRRECTWLRNDGLHLHHNGNALLSYPR